jgi:hypothetical protein
MTFQWFGGDNATLLESEADWISPRGENYLDDPPVADGRKVVVFDNDHVCGVCPGESFVWKSFFRGHNPIYMDPLSGDDPVYPDPDAAAAYEQARSAMKQTLHLARQIDLRWMEPRPDLTSTAYALADPEAISGLPGGSRRFSVDLRSTSGVRGPLADMAGKWASGPTVRGGTEFDPPAEAARCCSETRRAKVT